MSIDCGIKQTKDYARHAGVIKQEWQEYFVRNLVNISQILNEFYCPRKS